MFVGTPVPVQTLSDDLEAERPLPETIGRISPPLTGQMGVFNQAVLLRPSVFLDT